MRFAAFLLTVAAVAVAPALGADGSATSTPALRLVDRDPLVLRGTGFRAAERVRLSVNVGGAIRLRSIRATRAGSFTARFDTVAVARCTGLAASAAGARGSRAALTLRPRSCVPPP